ncbi:MAG: response regulator transcription factor [Candidatus Eremiobacteraeota bacterium]|nr:response regulator transcription factor [Candidatus Eremiobacteraeota bacterium]
MKVLIAEDDFTSRRMLEAMLSRWDYEVISTVDGDEAWGHLSVDDPPRLAVLDWMMPGMDGVEICRRLRDHETPTPVYIVLLTTRGRKEDIVMGLDAGANDYITKPFDREELKARLKVGQRVVELQAALVHQVTELQAALAHVRTLQSILPICSYCKKIRDDKDYWHNVESYIADHTGSEFSHSICPGCYEKFVEPELRKFSGKKPRGGGAAKREAPH